MKKTLIRSLAKRHGLTVEQIASVHSIRAMTEEGMEKIPAKAIRKSLRRVDFPDMPRNRQMFRLEQAGVRSSSQEEALLQRAIRQCDSMRMRASGPATAGVPSGGFATAAAPVGPVPAPVAGLALNQWTELGPGKIGGRTRAIVIHPTDPDRIWIGSAGGGVWHTADAGAHWSPVDDFMGNLAVTSLVIDPTDPNVLYAGTGEGFGNLDSLRGAGLFRTTDGANWSQLSGTANSNFHHVNRLGTSADGATLFAATNRGIFRSVDPARAVWTRVSFFTAGDLKCHPNDPLKAIAGSLNSGEIIRTVDGGLSWTPATHSGFWDSRIELCYSAADPDTIYASININSGEIWRSKNGGKSFSKRSSRNMDNDPARYLGDQGWYDNTIWAGDPTDEDLVIVGGIDLWRSTNAGTRLSDISTWWESGSVHADHHAICSHPGYNGTTNRIVYFGNDGGIYRTDDVTTAGNDPVPHIFGWENLNNSYGVTQFYGGAVNEATGVIVCGAQDNGTLAFHPVSGGAPGNWVSIFGGDGGYCASDPTDSDVFYGEYVFLNIHRNLDGALTDDTAGDRYISGQFWNPAIGEWDWKPIPFRIPEARTQDALFIAPFALDRQAPETILAGGRSLWRTTDAKAPNTFTSGPRWSQIKSLGNGKISAIAIDPLASDHVWVGHETGEIWRSINATDSSPSWVRINNYGSDPLDVSRYCHHIEVSPHNSADVLVTFGDYASGNVWRTRDKGLTWVNISATLPEAPVRSATFHPAKDTWIYIGTEVGVFASEDFGVTWSPSNEGPANVSVDDLKWLGNTLVCITHGRGVFTIDLNHVGF